MSLPFTFLCATNQAKALTLGGAFDFYKKKNWQERMGKDLINWTRPRKKKITENERKEDKDQIFESPEKGGKYTKVSEDISLSRFSVFISLGLWRS